MNTDIQQSREHNEFVKKYGQLELVTVVNAILEHKLPLTDAGAEEAARIVGACPCGYPCCARPARNPRLRETIINAHAVIAAARGAA